MKYYSQNYQDFWITTVLKEHKNGYFVDLGAGDGMFISNTYLLEKKYGWIGICVEPNEFLIPILRNNRKCIIDTNVIGKDQEDVKYVEYKSDIHTQMFSYITTNNVALYDSCISCSEKNIIDKKSISLNTLLDRYYAPKIIHYLSVDINNNDIEVIMDFLKTNFSRRIILAITVEHNNPSKADVFNSFLKDYDYLPSLEHAQDNNYVINNVEKYL